MLNRRQLIASGSGMLLAGHGLSAFAQEATPPTVSSTRYVSMNADTGAMFAQQGAHDQVAIASLTKVFTAMEAIQLAPLSTQITTTEADYQPADATVMGFGAGEVFSLEELIYGMMLPSGNDAAHAVARSLGYQDGDTAEEAVQRFMDMVNTRALAMGLENTHLLNPHGWGVPGHYSSAADVAAFMAYASTSDFLVQVMGTQRYTTSAGYVLVNTNRALSTAPSVLGGKTGYDWDSGWCLVQIAQRDNTRIVAVNLDGVAPDVWYNDNLLLLDFGFDQQQALGADPFGGEIMQWADPAPVLFAQAGSGEVSISGESEDQEAVMTRQETSSPTPIRTSPVRDQAPEPPVIDFDGHKSDGILAGVGAAALAGIMAVSRWADHGGDRSSETIAPSIQAATGSLKRMLPTLPSIKRPEASAEQGIATDLPELDPESQVDVPATEIEEDSFGEPESRS